MTPIIRHDPQEAEKLLPEIEALLGRGENQKALALIEGSLASGPLGAETRETLLWKKELALFRLERYAEALGTLELLRPKLGETATWLREMALILYAMSREERPSEEATLMLLLAEEAFEGSIQGEPSQRELDFLEEVRDTLYPRKRCGEIINAIRRLPEEQRTSRNLQQMALALGELGEYDQALEIMEAIPGDREPRYWYTMGYLLYHRAFDGGSLAPDVSEARELLLRCQEGNPGALLALECRNFLETMAKNIYYPRLGNNDRLDWDSLQYDTESWIAVGEHIRKQFGSSDRCFRCRSQVGLDLDMPIIPPAKEGEGHLVCTQGLGAVVMEPPRDEEEFRDLRRVELFFPMAPGWDPTCADPKELWPSAALLELVKLPLADPKAWLGPGSIFDLPKAALWTGQRCALILPPVYPYENIDPCILPNGEPVQFCQVLFLYPEEARLVVDQGLEALWEKTGGENYLVYSQRENACKA